MVPPTPSTRLATIKQRRANRPPLQSSSLTGIGLVSADKVPDGFLISGWRPKRDADEIACSSDHVRHAGSQLPNPRPLGFDSFIEQPCHRTCAARFFLLRFPTRRAGIDGLAAGAAANNIDISPAPDKRAALQPRGTRVSWLQSGILCGRQ